MVNINVNFNTPPGGTPPSSPASVDNYFQAETMLTMVKMQRLIDSLPQAKTQWQSFQQFSYDTYAGNVGQNVTSLTGSNILGNIAGNRASQHFSQGGSFSKGMGMVTLAFSALSQTVQMVDSRMQSLAESIAPFSGPVASATAQVEVMRIQAMLNRADALGPDTGRYVAARGKIEYEFMELKTAVLTKIVPLLANMAEGVADSVEGLGDATNILLTHQGISDTLRATGLKIEIMIAQLVDPDSVPALRRDLEEIKKRLEDMAKGPEFVNRLDKELEELFKFRKDPGGPAFFNQPEKAGGFLS